MLAILMITLFVTEQRSFVVLYFCNQGHAFSLLGHTSSQAVSEFIRPSEVYMNAQQKKTSTTKGKSKQRQQRLIVAPFVLFPLRSAPTIAHARQSVVWKVFPQSF